MGAEESELGGIDVPVAGLAKPTWTAADSETVPRFSALHFAFGERLHRELKVPVGLIVGAVGGTPSGYWIPPATYASSRKCKAEVAEMVATYDRASALKLFEAKLAAWEKAAADAKANGKKPSGRKPVPPAGPGESSRGGKIGGLYERYIAPVAGYRIRGVLWDQGEAGSGVVGIGQHTMMSELIRGWREAWGQGEFPFLFVQKPSGGGCAWSNDDPITRNGNPFAASLPDIPRNGAGKRRYLYMRLMRDMRSAIADDRFADWARDWRGRYASSDGSTAATDRLACERIAQPARLERPVRRRRRA